MENQGKMILREHVISHFVLHFYTMVLLTIINDFLSSYNFCDVGAVITKCGEIKGDNS